MNKRHISNILRDYEQKRKKNEQTILDRKNEMYAKFPVLFEIDKKMRSNAAKVAIVAFENDDNVEKAIESLKQNHQSLKQLRQNFLIENKYPKTYLEEIYDCPNCKDYGYVGTNLCSCVEKESYIRQKHELTSLSGYRSCDFSAFDLNLYSKTPDARYKISPYDNMSRNLKRCMEYAENFDISSGNLLFIGNPGLSKTFLSSCIAKTIANNSNSVVFETCIEILNNFEQKKFADFDPAVHQKVKSYSDCDLLIIDDLGTEMVTNFTIPTLYNIINERIIKKKPMIINTNFVLPELSKKYSHAIASRLDGEFTHVFFFGDDVRKILKNT